MAADRALIALPARVNSAEDRIPSSSIEPAKQRLAWIDVLKGVAIAAVLLHHFPATNTGFGLRLTDRGIASSCQRIALLANSITVNRWDAAMACVAAFGYQGVHLFLIASGFGLAIADSRRKDPLRYTEFLQRRAARLLPPYWTFVLILGVTGFLQSRLQLMPTWVIGSSRSDLLVNFLLLRDFREKWVWIFPGAFWFVPLIIQLYLCYPLVAWGMRRFGIGRALIAYAIITLLYRAFATWIMNSGPVGTDGDHTSVPMMFFPARLFEFSFGAALAQAKFFESASLRKTTWRAGLFIFRLAVWATGTAAASFRAGFVISDPLIGVGLFFAAYQFCCIIWQIRLVGGAAALLGRSSYSVYLVHSMLIPSPFVFQPGHSFLRQFVIFVAISLGLAALLEGLQGGIGMAFRKTRTANTLMAT